MPKSNELLTKHTLFLRSGDFAFLRERFPHQPTSVIVRRVVSSFVDRFNQPLAAELVEELAKEVPNE